MFFDASINLSRQITTLYDFLWPTAVAMWNLRWQVQGYLLARPDASPAELTGRFAEGSGLQGTHLRRACTEHSWESQQERFAGFLLIQVIAVYEAWAADVVAEVGGIKQDQRNLQFPTSPDGSTGVAACITRLTLRTSSTLPDALYPALASDPKYAGPRLENLMICYRFFKECRNTLLHSGGLADSAATAAYAAFAPIASPAALGVREVPQHRPLVAGLPVSLTLRGVVGFSDVLLRITTSVDAELSRSTKAEAVVRARWLRRFGKRRFTLRRTGTPGRGTQIRGLANRMGFPTPTDIGAMERLLLDLGLVN